MPTILLWPLLTVASLATAAQGAADQARSTHVTAAEREIIAADQALNEAFVRGDVAALERIMTDDYVSTSPLGNVRNRTEALDMQRAGLRRSFSLVADDVRVRVYGDSAVLTSRRIERGEFRGRDVSGQFRTTRVYVRQDGRWRLAAMQTTPIAPDDSSGTVEQEVLAAEEVRRQAILGNDIGVLEGLIADNFVVTLDTGEVKTRADELAVNRAGARRVEAWDSSDVVVRVYGHTAVVVGRAAVRDSLQGRGRAFRFSYTHVWARLDGRWRLIARHVSNRSTPQSD